MLSSLFSESPTWCFCPQWQLQLHPKGASSVIDISSFAFMASSKLITDYWALSIWKCSIWKKNPYGFFSQDQSFQNESLKPFLLALNRLQSQRLVYNLPCSTFNVHQQQGLLSHSLASARLFSSCLDHSRALGAPGLPSQLWQPGLHVLFSWSTSYVLPFSTPKLSLSLPLSCNCYVKYPNSLIWSLIAFFNHSSYNIPPVLVCPGCCNKDHNWGA